MLARAFLYTNARSSALLGAAPWLYGAATKVGGGMSDPALAIVVAAGVVAGLGAAAARARTRGLLA